MNLPRIMIVAFFLSTASRAALALSAASPEQLLCSHEQIVVAEVLAGRSFNCPDRSPNPATCFQWGIKLSIKIARVLAVLPQLPRESQIKIQDSLMVSLRESSLYVLAPHVDASDTSLTDEQVVAPAIGKQYVFGIGPYRRQNPVPAPSTVWPIADMAWVMATLQKPSQSRCPRPIVNDRAHP